MDLLGRQHEVDEEVLDLRCLVPVLLLEQMDRLGRGREKTDEVVPARHEDALGDEGAGIESAHRGYPKIAVVIDMAHEESDRVHVSAQHHAWRCSLAYSEQA